MSEKATLVGRASLAKRFACDRCHAQKLRCPRVAVSGNTQESSCMRCRKAGKPCSEFPRVLCNSIASLDQVLRLNSTDC